MPVAITSDAGPNTANIAPVEFSDRKVATPALLKPPAHVGLASWYGPGFTGKKTASGDIFDDRELTAAHRTLPLGSKAKVTNLSNGKSVYVEINDRGPFVEDRIIDLSQAAASALGMIDQGIVQVRIDLLTGEEGLEAGGVD
ncbi:MAG: septal ring lytic transglycosylase RlpA family protein [Candidatus Binatia bacterium]